MTEKVRAWLRDTVTGESRVHVEDLPPWWQDDPRDAVFWWVDGNGGCDCNRLPMFYAPDERYPPHVRMEQTKYGPQPSCRQTENDDPLIELVELRAGPWVLVRDGVELDEAERLPC